MIIAFSGHRPNKLQYLGGYDLSHANYNLLRKQIAEVLIEKRCTKVISGMALGIDQLAVQISLALEIPFIAAVPYLGQEKMWPMTSQEEYHALLKRAEEVVVVSGGSYAAFKMQNRNIWMCDNCDLLIAVWDGDSTGGTSNCVNYAKSIHKEILIINPKDFIL